VFCRPDDDLEDDRKKVDSLLGEAVDSFGAMLGVSNLFHDAEPDEVLEPTRQDVRSDPFPRGLELTVVVLSAQSDVANDEKGPSIAEEIEPVCDGALGSPMHINTVQNLLAICKWSPYFDRESEDP